MARYSLKACRKVDSLTYMLVIPKPLAIALGLKEKSEELNGRFIIIEEDGKLYFGIALYSKNNELRVAGPGVLVPQEPETEQTAAEDISKVEEKP